MSRDSYPAGVRTGPRLFGPEKRVEEEDAPVVLGEGQPGSDLARSLTRKVIVGHVRASPARCGTALGSRSRGDAERAARATLAEHMAGRYAEPCHAAAEEPGEHLRRNDSEQAGTGGLMIKVREHSPLASTGC